MRLRNHGVVIGGPPCSLNIWLSSSVHRRSLSHPEGDTRNYKVRLSNLIAANTACWLTLLRDMGKVFYWALEQPSPSWLWRLECMIGLTAAFGAARICTWMAFFGHDMLKPSTLMGTLPGLAGMRRVMRKADRGKFKRRFAWALDDLPSQLFASHVLALHRPNSIGC
ncbi:RHM1 [Symbiodinium natans]|uniref:RHM1 protein n=1 Tax=Symbiodinium natans TaxID=878477 RepID=A0A812PHR0_9DINO|nr:RHM1 [Symbiodinium natans]